MSTPTSSVGVLTDAEAFLRVGDSSVLNGLVAEEQIIERIHACIDEHLGSSFTTMGAENDLVSFLQKKSKMSVGCAVIP